MSPHAAMVAKYQSPGSSLQASIAAADAALKRGDYAKAVHDLQRAVSIAPNDVRLLLNLGGALKELGRFDEALPALSHAVAIDPQRHGAWSNLGTVSLELQRYDDAIASFSNAIRLKEDHAPALAGLAVALRRRGLPREALPFFDLALAASPGDISCRVWRAMALLAAGDYLRGFAEYEWRFHESKPLPNLPDAPRWKGEPLNGRTLLVHGEAGLGDCLQFCRYIPMLREQTCHVVVQVPPPLVRLFSRLPGVDATISSDQHPPTYDLSCSVMSLPYIFRTTVDLVPHADGYLVGDPAIVANWQERVDEDVALWQARTGRVRRRPLKVGLVWSGGRRPWNLENTLTDNRRSMSLATLAPLAAADGDALFYSLQIGAPQAEAANPPPGLHLVDHTDKIRDFEDTAGLVALLDLVIAVDTSTAHLAAAMGRPVWLLSRYDQCWRWLTGRTDSPWYSSMKLYIQPVPLDWTAPVKQIVTDLAALLAARTPDVVPPGSKVLSVCPQRDQTGLHRAAT